MRWETVLCRNACVGNWNFKFCKFFCTSDFNALTFSKFCPFSLTLLSSLCKLNHFWEIRNASGCVGQSILKCCMLCLHRGASVPEKLQDSANWTLVFLIQRCHRKNTKFIVYCWDSRRKLKSTLSGLDLLFCSILYKQQTNGALSGFSTQKWKKFHVPQ